jgi:prepilin-type N-terminal cleavage/methylation domain-containing protein
MKKNKGFTLVEMAVVLVIAGALLSAGLKMYSVLAERSAISVTKQHQETIKQAIISYLGRTGRLPCPDQDIDGADNNRDASGNCTANFGTLPYITIGLDRESALDGWDNYLAYVVSPTWILTYSNTATQYTTTDMNSAFWPGVRNGAITVVDRNPPTSDPGQTINDPSAGVNTGAVVALISYGRNGSGARNTANQTNENPSGADELANVNITGLKIYKRQFIDQDVAPGGAFDDVVLTMSASDIVTPLINDGAFQSATAAAILNQANDYVVSKIIATKSICTAPPANGCSTVANYYYTIPSVAAIPFTSGSGAPDNTVAWGVSYSPTVSTFSSGTPSTAIAYILTVGTQSRTIYFPELIGYIGRVSGY